MHSGEGIAMLKDLCRKRTPVFKKRDREGWEEMKKVLKDAGIPGIRSGHYLQETVMGGGCGAKLDPRDFGGKGKIDRDIYWIEVPVEEEAHVKEVLLRNGLVAAVEEDVLLDAALRKKQKNNESF